jgi:hypothetical protein
MRTWKRAELQILCGLCHRGIYREQPYLELRSEAWTKPKVRCRECAGEAVPAELPSLPIKPVRQGLPFARFSAGMLPLDFKQKAANE